jgi:hypothetical protein
MISFGWMFIGALVGLLVVSVFRPPPRKIPTLPTPDNNEPFFTTNGCVKFKSMEQECTPTATSLASKV